MNPSPAAVPRPPARLILGTPEHLFAFGFGLGLSPVAPGTMGSLLGIPLAAAMLFLPWQGFVALVVLLFLAGCYVCGASARMLKVDDYGGIVFDEVVGYVIACAPLLPVFAPPDWPLLAGLAAAFVLFRIFDIAKPWPIRWFDRNLKGGLGIMVDDVLAGVGAGAVLWLLGYAWAWMN